MVKLFSQSQTYDDPWPTVAFAFFLRYPNRYAAHVLSCDVIDRHLTPSGTLRTTRLILKRGALPAWFPRSIVQRGESWIVEESEVDVLGKVLKSMTRNLDHVKALQVLESQSLRELPDGKTMHKTEAQFISRFGWGLTRRIEEYSMNKFKVNIEKSRQGFSLVIRVLREARRQSFGSPSRLIFPRAEHCTVPAQNNNSSNVPSPQVIAYLACADDGDRFLSISHKASTSDGLLKPKEAKSASASTQEESSRLSWLRSWLWPSR